VNRGRSPTRTTRRSAGRSGIDPIICRNSFSTSSNDTAPRSHSPTSRTSLYVNRVHSARLQALLHPAGESEYPGVRCVVKSLPYTNSKLGLSGYYTGKMDVISKLPDGEGILYCHDGQIFHGEWRLGAILPVQPIVAKRCSAESSDTCDSSTCSSLSASITRLPRTENDTPVKKIKVPKYLYIVTHTPLNMVPCKSDEDVEVMPIKSALSKVESQGNVNEDTGTSSLSSNVHVNDSIKPDKRTRFSWKPLVSKVCPKGMNSFCR
jgi:hypothetical protein